MIDRVTFNGPEGDLHYRQYRQPVRPGFVWKNLKHFGLLPLFAVGLLWDSLSTLPTSILQGTLFDSFPHKCSSPMWLLR